MTEEKVIYVVAREGHAEQFESRMTAKVVYEQWKQEYPSTVLKKVITKVQTLMYHEKSGCWL